MKKFEVICIDDEKAILEYYHVILEEIPYTVVSFHNSVEASEYILNNHKKIILILSDFSMPDMTGFDVREKMLEAGLDTPFAVITALYDKEMAVNAMKLKICEFIKKPFEETDVLKILETEGTPRAEFLNEELEMVSDFLQETSPMLEEIEDLILELEEDRNSETAINTYFRLLHTIKGTSSCLGLNELSSFAHKYEDLIGDVQKGAQVLNTKVVNVLLQGLDYLKKMYAAYENNEELPFVVEDVVGIFTQDFKTTEVDSKVEEEQVDSVKSESKQKVEKIAVSVDILSDFLELSGELTVLRNTIVKNITKLQTRYSGDKDIDLLSDNIGEVHKVSSQLQNQIGDMKKISIDNVLRPMKRVVRDSCKACAKEVNFRTEGDELRVDTSIGKLLNNVLVHLLRNGVDHGIELPDVRVANGKKSEGLLDLKCYESAEDIIVEIIDDGNGIDVNRIKSKALEKGLYSDDALNAMSEQRVFQILFESGFSTNEEVTSISGRGVGMDMVKSSVEEAGGKIYIESTPGKGSRFILSIPIPRSILIINSLMVVSSGQKFSIPLDEVGEVVLFEDEKDHERLHTVDGSLILTHHEELIPLIKVNELLGIGNEFDRSIFSIVIVRGENFKYGLIVDAIDDIEEIVVKKVSDALNRNNFFMGVTFIGDGELGLILNAEGIAKFHNMDNEISETSFKFAKEDTFTQSETDFMRFDLKSHNNYSIPLEWVYRLEKLPSKLVQYSGDKVLLRYRDGNLPLVFLEHELGLNKESVSEFLQNNEELDIIVSLYGGRTFGLVVSKMQDIGVTTNHLEIGNSDRREVLGTVFIGEELVNVIDAEFILKGFIEKPNLDKKEIAEEKSYVRKELVGAA